MPFMFLDSFTQKQCLPKVHLLIQHYLKECLLHHCIYIKKRCQQSGRNSFFQNRAKGRITHFNISVACNAAEAIASTLSCRIVENVQKQVYLSVVQLSGYTKKLCNNISTGMGFEPARVEPIGLAVHRLNHSATPSASSNSSQLVLFLIISSCHKFAHKRFPSFKKPIVAFTF